MSSYTSWYREGSVSVTNGNNVVTGNRTYWTTAGIHPGDIFKVGGLDYEVGEVTSDTTLTVIPEIKSATSNKLEYAVIRNFTASMSTEIAAKAIDLLGKFTKYVDADMQTVQGKSAYEIAKENGFTGSIAQWLESLKADNEWSKLDERTSLLDYGGAELHNSITRGKNLGSAPTPEQMAAIRDGSFKDLWIGDYWQNGNNVFRIAHFNYYQGLGGNSNNPLRSKPHLIVISGGRLYNGDTEQFAAWETIPEGGYIATPHNEFIQTTGLDIVKSFFGEENLIAHPRRVSNGIADHKVTSTVYQEVITDAVCAQQLFNFNPSINDTDVDIYNAYEFASAQIHSYLVRYWGIKQLRTLAAVEGAVCAIDYGFLGAREPNSAISKELLVMCCLG